MADKTHNHTPGGACELCGDVPDKLMLAQRCHPRAPMRAALAKDGVLSLYCYLPECNRHVASFLVSARCNEPAEAK